MSFVDPFTADPATEQGFVSGGRLGILMMIKPPHQQVGLLGQVKIYSHMDVLFKPNKAHDKYKLLVVIKGQLCLN